MGTVTLFLMTKKGYSFLRDIVDTYQELIEEVVVGSDVALDYDYADSIIELCKERGLRWCRRTQDHRIHSQYVMAVSWRWMIDHPENRLIVFHDSLLPKYRGFNPLVTALINGDHEVGVTALLGAKEYDAGAILAQSSIKVQYPIKIATAIDQLSASYRECAFMAFKCIKDGVAEHSAPQNEALATYSLWRDDCDYRVPWGQSAAWIERFVDALSSPYKGALTTINGVSVRILEARALPDVSISNRDPGKVFRINNDRPIVVCGHGLLEIYVMQDDFSKKSILPLTNFRIRFG